MASRDSQTLLAKWRAKYPGAYDNVDDESLYGAIIKKHPEYSDVKFGTSGSHENMLQKAIKSQSDQRYSPFESAVSTAVGGPMMAGGGAMRAEDIAVPAIQMGTDLAQDLSPARILPDTAKGAITTGTTTLAEGARQGIRSLRGEGFDSGQIGRTAATTGASELAGRGIGKFFMGKAATRNAVRQGYEKLGAMKDAIRTAGEQNPNLSIPKQPILDTINELYSKSVNPKGPASSIFKDWIKILSDPNTTHISPTALLQMEDQFGQASKFFPKGSNFLEKVLFKITNPIKDTVLNSGAKEVRNLVSGEVDNVAERAGVHGFSDASRAFSEAKNASASGGNDWLKQLLGGASEVGAGAIAGQALGHNPALGATLGIVDLIRRNTGVQDAIYKAVGKSGIGALGNTAIAQVGRKSDKNY